MTRTGLPEGSTRSVNRVCAAAPAALPCDVEDGRLDDRADQNDGDG
jgi:hypothetical protein